MNGLRLIGYRHSVFTRAARIAMVELALEHDWQEANPFLTPVPGHPFRRVPVLEHGAIRIYETWAILTYLNALAGRPGGDALSQARAAQVAGIVSSYAYWPLVRQVYSHAVFRSAMGETADMAKIETGLAEAQPVLDELDILADEGIVLGGKAFGLADWLLFPMIDAFAQAEEGRAMTLARPALAAWWRNLAARPGIAQTFTPLDDGL